MYCGTKLKWGFPLIISVKGECVKSNIYPNPLFWQIWEVGKRNKQLIAMLWKPFIVLCVFHPCPWHQLLSTSTQTLSWELCLGVLKVPQTAKVISQFVNFLSYTWSLPVFPNSSESVPPSSSSNPNFKCDPWIVFFLWSTHNLSNIVSNKTDLLAFGFIVNILILSTVHFSPATLNLLSSLVYDLSLFFQTDFLVCIEAKVITWKRRSHYYTTLNGINCCQARNLKSSTYRQSFCRFLALLCSFSWNVFSPSSCTLL